MKQIPKDRIEMAEDFINHLSKDKMIEHVLDFNDEQPKLMQMMYYASNSIKEKSLRKRCHALSLIIIRCYKYYGIKIPSITADIIIITKEQYDKFTALIPTHKRTYLELFEDFKTLIKQDNLMDYIILKFEGTIDKPVYYESDNDKKHAVDEMLIIMLCLNNEIKKHVGDEGN